VSKCPVLHELDTREDYGDEMNPPVLSGGDYDISAIRSCADNCKAASLAWSRGERLRSIALILGLAPGDTAEIDNTVRELIRSRDEWLERAAAHAARLEELVRDRDKWRSRAKQSYLDLDASGKKLTKLCLIARRIRSAFTDEDRSRMSSALQSFFEEVGKP
jgi:hypothetical protein